MNSSFQFIYHSFLNKFILVLAELSFVNLN